MEGSSGLVVKFGIAGWVVLEVEDVRRRSASTGFRTGFICAACDWCSISSVATLHRVNPAELKW